MKNIISGIYAIVNLIDGHKYIGSSVNIDRRFKKHKTELRCGKHHSRNLQNAWNNYGESDFLFSVLAVVKKENLLSVEQSFIDEFSPEYNISPTAGSRFGCVHLEVTKQKISKSHLGLRPSEETRKKLSESHKGLEIGSEQRRKMSESMKGKYRGWSDKAILQLTRDSLLVRKYESVMDAQRATGVINSAIVRCAKGKRPTAGGFIWRYADLI